MLALHVIWFLIGYELLENNVYIHVYSPVAGADNPLGSEYFEPRREKTIFFAYAKTKTQISFAVTAKLISAFVFATWIVQFLFYLNPKFQASSHFPWLYSPVCVGPGQKPRRLVFSQRGSFHINPNRLSLCSFALSSLHLMTLCLLWLSLPFHSGSLKRNDYLKQICLAHPHAFECFHCS